MLTIFKNWPMNAKERIIQYLDSKGISISKMESELGWGNGGFAKTKSISTEKTIEFLLRYTDVSPDWLLLGNGEMCRTEEVGGKAKSLPRIPYDAAAGSLTDTVDGVSEYQCEKLPVIAAFPRYDFTIRVTGRSMEPMYFSGDEVACLRVNEYSFLQWGRVHVLDTTQGVVIKRIYDNGDSIRCVSYNPEYPDFNIPKEDIRSYNLVVGALRL